MIDPVIVSIHIGRITLSLHWYAVFVIGGILVGTWIAAREIRRRGENPEHLWDGLTWVVPAGIVGARLWYVVTDILGGGTRYLENPLSILYTVEGGLHYYGAMLFGALAAYVFVRQRKLDMWLVLDSVAPSLLIGQAVARPANFINQELYGQPTELPWGISIQPQHRIPPWNDLSQFPVETTRFHPTFAYEMIWNFLAGGLLLWLANRFPKKIKPGAVFAGWLILAGLGRELIEFFRPDQPRVPGTDISYTRIVSALMILAGAFIVLIKYEVIRLPFLSPGRDTYFIAEPEPAPAAPAVEESGS